MSKHTPGPWRVGADTYSGEQHQMVIDELGFILFDSVNRTGPPESQLADMTLAAAAPEMLEALKAILRDPTGCSFCDMGRPRKSVLTGQLCEHDEQCGFLLARAALAKAEGRS